MLEWIVTASLLVLLVILLRRLPIAPWQRYALWLVVLVRLLVPVQLFTIPAAASVLPDVGSAMENMDLYAIPTGKMKGIPQQDVDTMLETFQPGEVFTYSYTDRNFYLNPDIQFSVQYNTGCGVIEEDGVYTYALYTNLRQVLLLIYGIGVLAALLILLRSNCRFFRQLKKIRRPLGNTGSRLPVYVAEGLPSPCLFGVLHPAIYLTPEAAADEATRRHVLAHEETHFRHGDHIWSLLRCLALAVHWWNPLVWLAAILSRRDGELCCDAATLSRLGNGERRAYGETLLSLVTAKPGPREFLSCSTTMTSGKRGLQERVRWIARRPKVLVSVSILVVLVALAAVGCAFGQPSDESWKTAELMVDQDGIPYRRDAGETEWTPLGEAIAPPAEWTEQDLAGRNELTALSGADEYRAALVSATDGWLTATYGRGVAAADTYVYRTEDGGATWTETAPPDTSWYLSAVGFLSTERAILAERCFDGAPVHLTADGGKTWEGIPLPDGAYEVEAILWDGDTVLLAVSNSLEAESGWIMRSGDLGDTWETEETASLAEYLAKRAFTFATVPQTMTADVTHDGTPDTLTVAYHEADGLWQLTVSDGVTGEQIWSEEAGASHAGWNALFLCTLEGEDYLLRYHPTMYQGICSYAYQLFWLEDDQPVTADSGALDFDVNTGSSNFDPESIVAFLEKVNDYLSHSVQLMNTDEELLSSFTRLGRLEDDLWWLAAWEGYDPEESTEENLSRYAQQIQTAGTLGDQADQVYERLSATSFAAAVEGEDGQRWEFTIDPEKIYNDPGGSLAVYFLWSEAGQEAWNAQQGYRLTCTSQSGEDSIGVCSGGDVVRIQTGDTVTYLKAVYKDNSSYYPESMIFRGLLMPLEDVIAQGVWDNAVVDGSVTDLETVAAQLTEQIARGYRELPDFLVWKPNDVQIQENPQRVFDAWHGESPNFCFNMGIYVSITDPMSAQGSYWQPGAGLPDEPAFEDYYPWGLETLVVLDQETNLWRIRDRGTGGYTVSLPFDLATAPVEELVDAWYLSEGFTHDYRLFYYLCDRPLTDLTGLSDALDRRSREEAEAFLLGLKSHMEEYPDYHNLTLSDITSVLDRDYAAMIS